MIRLLALMAVLTLGACATTPPSGPPPPAILISIDGFRPTTWTVALRRCSPDWRRTGRLHYGRNARVAPIFCLPDPGWSITTRAFKPKKPDLGNHGFDPASPDMAAVFIRHGPAFRRGVRLPIFDNVDVYPLLARLAGVRARPGDGRLAPIRPALAT